MPKICYKEQSFHPKTLLEIEKVNAILDEYEAAGFDLTLRQVFYQFVSRDYIKNSMAEYKRLGSIINDARLAGLIDWNRIVDRTRFLRSLSHWDSPADIISGAMNSYREDLWAKQPCRIEVWIEKDALVGVIEAVCQRNDVPFFSCRGYTSQSEMWSAAQRLNGYHKSGDGQGVHIIHLGDHDPSGIDMTRDIQDRLDLFIYPGAVHMHRIALNMDQVRRYNPPPNPAKITDSRADKYIADYGTDSWELDALKPQVIVALIEKKIKELRDNDAWTDAVEHQDEEKKKLSLTHEHWQAVVKFVQKRNKP